MTALRRVCVFSGSSFGAREAYAEATRALAAALVARGIGLVYGGGSVGLMGVVADAVLAAGGEVIGVIPRALATKEIAHQGLADLRIVPSMRERKALMAELADGFVALPGGFGTFDELFEAITWAQLGLHEKPIAVLDVAGYFAPFLMLLDHATEERFVRPEHRALVISDADPARILDRLAAFRPVAGRTKWIGKDET
ncbi:MAG: TIGR00730 family Rossman fold protein [Deltaproteobacteria bacterium]|nr:TIGR00730 family Rossman fold protein [Deltaproteobacteria bacterium]